MKKKRHLNTFSESFKVTMTDLADLGDLQIGELARLIGIHPL